MERIPGGKCHVCEKPTMHPNTVFCSLICRDNPMCPECWGYKYTQTSNGPLTCFNCEHQWLHPGWHDHPTPAGALTLRLYHGGTD